MNFCNLRNYINCAVHAVRTVRAACVISSQIASMTKKKITLTEIQKYNFCLYARDNKKTYSQYIDWIEQKWGVRVDKSTVSRILATKNKRLASEVTNPEAKRHKAVIVPELELALKEFVLTYQHRAILSDTLLIEKAKLLAEELEVPEGTLQVVCLLFHFYLIEFKSI